MSAPLIRTSAAFVCALGIHQIVCWGTLTYGVTVFADLMAARYGSSIASVLTVYAIGLIANGLVAPRATHWTMRIGGWVPGLTGLLVGAIACAVLALAPNIIVAGIGFAIAGAAMALAQYDFAWLCVRLYHPHNARKVVTGVTLFGALASSIMWPVATFFKVRLGLTGGWLSLAAVMLAVGTPCLWALTHAKVSVARGHEHASTSPHAATNAAPLPNRAVWLLIIGLVIASNVGGAVATNLPFVLQSAHTPAALIATVLPLFGIGQLVARGADFLGSGRFGLNVTLIIAVCASLACWTLLLMPSATLTTALAVILLGAGNGLFTVVRGATPQLILHGEQFTHVSAQLARIGSYARAAAPIAIAYALEHSQSVLPTAAMCAAAILFGAYCVRTASHDRLPKH